jgi:hypothetical protein
VYFSYVSVMSPTGLMAVVPAKNYKNGLYFDYKLTNPSEQAVSVV